MSMCMCMCIVSPGHETAESMRHPCVYNMPEWNLECTYIELNCVSFPARPPTSSFLELSTLGSQNVTIFGDKVSTEVKIK